MRRVFTYPLALVVGTFVWACAPRPDDAPDFVVEDPEITGDEDRPDPASAAEEGNEGEAGPVLVEDTEPADMEPMEADAGSGGPDAGAPMTITKSQTCTSKYGNHRSVSKLTWTVTGTKLVIKSLTIQVSNAYKRNANDADISFRPPGGAAKFAFNTGDILTSGKVVNVRYKAATTVKAGHRVGILTNFDQEGGDPYASCSIAVMP